MLTAKFAEHFGKDWIEAWNSHDLDRILAHYSDDFTMSSPRIATVANEPSGTLAGKAAVGAYWRKALALVPDLHFELISTLVGADSVVLYYRGARGLAAEVFFFDATGTVVKSCAHYA